MQNFLPKRGLQFRAREPVPSAVLFARKALLKVSCNVPPGRRGTLKIAGIAFNGSRVHKLAQLRALSHHVGTEFRMTPHAPHLKPMSGDPIELLRSGLATHTKSPFEMKDTMLSRAQRPTFETLESWSSATRW